MSSPKLTAERTGSIFYRIIADDGRPIFATIGGGHDKPFTAEEIAENTRRLVACWNACVGVPTEDLERYYNTGGGIDKALEEASLQAHVKAIKQRDELLDAATALMRRGFFEPVSCCTDVDTRADMAQMLAAIDKATGGKGPSFSAVQGSAA